MEEKYKKFESHNWRDDDKWQAKLKNLYPPPAGYLLDKLKKKHFRDTVDKDFDVDYKPGEGGNA